MPEFFVLAGRDLGRHFELSEGDTLGRGEVSTAMLRDASISREHARLERQGERWFLVDLDSRNGMRVGRERVQRVELEDELEVQLGKIPLRVRLTSTGPSAVRRPDPPAADAHPAARSQSADGFVIEDDIDLDAATAALGPQSAASASSSASTARTTPRAAPEPLDPRQAERDAERARLLRSNERAGLFSSELSQLSAPLRWTLYLLVMIATGALFWAVVRTVLFLRAS